jgi:epoxyqueuosine reductase
VGVEVEPASARSPEAGKSAPGASAPVHPGTDAPSLVALLEMALDPEAWESFSRGSAIRRAGRAGFARNVCVAIGNWLASAPPGEPPEGAVDALAAALSDPEPLVRGHAAWALGRVAGAWVAEQLDGAAASETDAWVSAELEDARSKAG